MSTGIRCGLTVALLVISRVASAEVIGPLLPSGACELGIRWREFNRTMFYELSTTTFERNDATVFVRYGLTSNATIALELMAAPGDLVSEETVERFYSVGAALRTMIWKQDSFAITTGIHYLSSYLRRLPEKCDRETQSIDWELLGEWTTSLGDAYHFSAWGGPVLSHVSFSNQGPCDEDYWQPSEMLGATLGARFLFWDHVLIDGEVIWVENVEPRLAVAYRF